MKTLTRIMVLVLLGISCTCGQDEEFLGLPIEYDIFGLDPDATIFKETGPSTNVVPQELLQKLCDEYDLELDNKKINCQNIQIVSKSSPLETHVIEKRDADEETPLEGSGEPDVAVPESEIQPAADTAEEQNTREQAPGNENEEPVPNSDSTGENAPVQEETNNEEQPSPDAEPPQEEPNPDQPIEAPVPYGESESNNEPPSETDGSETPQEPNQDTPVEEEIKDEAPVPDAENDANNEPLSETDGSEIPQESNQDTAADTHDETPATDEETKEEEAVPYLNPETGEKEPAPTSDGKESEDNSPQDPLPEATNEEAKVEPVPYEETNKEDQEQPAETTANEESKLAQEEVPVPPLVHNNQETPVSEEPVQQTEASVLDVKKGRMLNPTQDAVNTGSESVESSDKAKSDSSKADLKESDLPKSGESSEGAQQGRKDTKVLIILLVAVVVVGGAAFAYNFIRKRKQRSSEESRTENGNSALQRAINEKDAEQGTELKPLMKSTDKTHVVEYKDEKNNAKAEVAK